MEETKIALNELAKHVEVELGWIKAHVNYKGNEMADTLAKTGTKLCNKAAVGPSRAHINSQITSHIYKEWDDRWSNTTGLRQTKLFIPNVRNRGRGKKARNLNRHDLGTLIRNLTGRDCKKTPGIKISGIGSGIEIPDRVGSGIGPSLGRDESVNLWMQRCDL